jgi:hypothetical protein
VVTNILEELTGLIFMVKADRDAGSSSKTVTTCRTLWCCNAEDHNPNF